MTLAMLVEYVKRIAKYILWWPASPKVTYFFGEPFFKLMGMRRNKHDLNLAQVEKVLIVRLDEIGDVVMTTPFLRELRRNLPDAWITLVVKPAVYNLVERCPYVNEVLVYDWNTKHRLLKPLQRHWRALQLAWKHLWKRRFDLAILPRWDVDSYHGSFVLYFSGAPWRVGYSENVSVNKKRFNRGFDRLLTHALKDSTARHEVKHNLDIIRFLGGEVNKEHLELWLSEEDETFAHEILKKNEVEPGDLLVSICPGAGAPKRQWPLSSYAELGLWFRQEYNARLLIIGGVGEESLGKELERRWGASAINIVGKTTLRQTVALLRHCRIYVGSDAGPMHLAAAVGVPVIAISCHPESGSPWSANSPLRFGPWGNNHIVIQPKEPILPCVDECIADRPHCILGITVEQVKKAVAERLPVAQTAGCPGKTAQQAKLKGYI